MNELPQKLPQSVGKVKILYTYKGKPHTYAPLVYQRNCIRLCPEGNPKIHVLKSVPWVLYSHIRQHLPGQSRAYFCLGESENGRAFAARVSLELWRACTVGGGEKAFISLLKPEPVMRLEKEFHLRATRIGNLWTLPLPTSWTHVREWAFETLKWDLVPRTRRNFRLLGDSGWRIEVGSYCRPWVRGGSKIAVAGGIIIAPELRQHLELHRPHLVGVTHGWKYL